MKKTMVKSSMKILSFVFTLSILNGFIPFLKKQQKLPLILGKVTQ